MSKYYGRIGFSETKQTSPGVYVEKIFFRKYKGDVLKNYRKWDQGESVNDNVNISNTLSIVADSFLYENLGAIKCIEWMGSFWDISSIEIQRPRLVLSIGGVYNGSTEAETSDDSGEDLGV